MGKYYSKNGVKGLRKHRRTIKSPYSSVSDDDDSQIRIELVNPFEAK